MERKLGWAPSQAAAELGYANRTSLDAIKPEAALLAPEKLVLAAEKLKKKKALVDWHWPFTGLC